MKTIAIWLGCMAMAAGFSMNGMAQNPAATITNGAVKATLLLPDAKTGYYRGTRFDWSGVVKDLEYAGHSYYGPWFTTMRPDVSDFIYEGKDIVTGPCSAIMGIPEEFQTNGSALGWDEAKAGETFVKIGVGVLRKPDGKPYSAYRLYDIVDGGKWTVHQAADAVEFTQEVNDPQSGYGYLYKKRVSLTPGKPQLVLEHSLKNIGKKAISSVVYDHNFLRMDGKGPGPETVIRFGFEPESAEPIASKLVALRGQELHLSEPIPGEEHIMLFLRGAGAGPHLYDLKVEDRKLGIGVHATSDRPLAKLNVWGIRAVISPEPFIDIHIQPGEEFTWKIVYDYYTFTPQAH